MNGNRFLLALALTVSVGACAPMTSYTEAEAPKNLKLDSSSSQFEMRYAPGSAALVPGDAARLRQLAASGAIGPADRVLVAAAGSPGLAEQRTASVSVVLLHYGIIPVATQLARVRPEHAVIDVTRTLVTPPACPNWSKPSGGGDFGNQPSSNFGCATASNLGMMVANPTDLAGGLPIGPSAGQPGAAAVNRYLNEKVTPLPTAGGASPFSSTASTPTAAPSAGSQ